MAPYSCIARFFITLASICTLANAYVAPVSTLAGSSCTQALLSGPKVASPSRNSGLFFSESRRRSTCPQHLKLACPKPATTLYATDDESSTGEEKTEGGAESAEEAKAEESPKEAPSSGSEMKTSKTNENRPSGWKNAIFMGPPLFAKFMIVLVVKFLTDLVVFPCLFLYRMARLMRNKIFNLIKRDEQKGGDNATA
jgi:hypothetical protein